MSELISTLLNNNHPVLNGAISVALAGGAIYLLKELPSRIWRILVEQFTTTVNLSNYNISYYHLLRYFKENNLTKYSRILTLYNGTHGHSNELSVGPGSGGTHYIYVFNKFMKINVFRNSNSNSERDKEEMSITYLGRDQSLIKNLIKLIEQESAKKTDPDKIKLYKWYNHWCESGTDYKRSLDSVIIDDDTINLIIKTIDDFYANKEIYKKLGKPYRLSIMLHGQPGTGKTSLIKALASKYEKNLAIISADNTDDLDNALNEIPKNSFVVIEDVDSVSGTASRKKKNVDLFDKMDSRKTSGILNSLDGIGSYTDSVLFMTTNHLKKLDPALTRKGRIDLSIEIKPPSLKTLKEKVTQDPKELNVIKNMKGCDLQDWMLKREIDV